MNTYVMSDIHGQYSTFRRMLARINLQKDDKLYILGDAIDRGPDGIKILQHILEMPNVEFVLGNHELLLLDALHNLRDIIDRDRHDTDDLDLWRDPCNGGIYTYERFLELPGSEQKRIEEYLQNAWIIRKLKINKKTFYLSHAYALKKPVGNGVKYPDLTHAEIWSVVWQSIYERRFATANAETLFPNKRHIYIAGHTFTQRLDCLDENGRGKVFHSKDYYGYQVYNIDCGMALKNKSSQLACMRLEDEVIFYESLL